MTFTYTTETYSFSAYSELLKTAGLKALLNQSTSLEVSAEVEQHPIKYGADYALGDIMPVKLEPSGTILSARVLSVKKVYEPSGNRTLVGLGEFQ